ncbi:hypothetical protein AU377_10415 [Sporosarcina sp. HYO08]|nr:nucleotidyltransferase [Sporosarcina sp. HYO08]KXH79883.1 hypothetical protein AU377_10415 [Sporosarcina sp. HYO08]
MKATGIVVEYNPFHNGHLHHVKEAKRTTGADVIIAIMSGNFLQRGEPALVDKWTRTRMAIHHGVDLIFELPYAFATANAPVFAKGAIELLDALCCDAFCFGSENGQVAPFENSLRLIEETSERYEQSIKEAVQNGMSYPKALNEAYHTILNAANVEAQTVVDLKLPNNILGFHYMQAAQTINTKMSAATIPRKTAQYHDTPIVGNRIASATGIRKVLFESEQLDEVTDFLPQKTVEMLFNWQSEGKSFGSWDAFYPLLRYTILRSKPEQLAQIADVTEGIENRIYRAAIRHETFESFMNEVKSKRYTWTRIQRMLTHIFTGFTYSMRKNSEKPAYLRLLGMTPKGRSYLNETKKELKLPIISRAAAFSDPSFTFDTQAADLYMLGIGEANKVGMDYQMHPVILQ